jgi:hypothetical protein
VIALYRSASVKTCRAPSAHGSHAGDTFAYRFDLKIQISSRRLIELVDTHYSTTLMSQDRREKALYIESHKTENFRKE